MPIPPRGFVQLPLPRFGPEGVCVAVAHVAGFHDDPETGGSRVYVTDVAQRENPILVSLTALEVGDLLDSAQWQPWPLAPG